jgi:hypothetical protein
MKPEDARHQGGELQMSRIVATDMRHFVRQNSAQLRFTPIGPIFWKQNPNAAGIETDRSGNIP